jgi:hypothetical protein
VLYDDGMCVYLCCLQVSGIRFAFDPSQPPGSRVLRDSVTIGSERAPLDPGQSYALATKQYLAEGKDGYDVLQVIWLCVVQGCERTLQVLADVMCWVL